MNFSEKKKNLNSNFSKKNYQVKDCKTLKMYESPKEKYIILTSCMGKIQKPAKDIKKVIKDTQKYDKAHLIFRYNKSS